MVLWKLASFRLRHRAPQISRISAIFIHRKGRLHCHRHEAEEKATSPVASPISPCLRPNLSLVICTVPHSLILRGTFSVCATPEGQRERSRNSHGLQLRCIS